MNKQLFDLTDLIYKIRDRINDGNLEESLVLLKDLQELILLKMLLEKHIEES